MTFTAHSKPSSGGLTDTPAAGAMRIQVAIINSEQANAPLKVAKTVAPFRRIRGHALDARNLQTGVHQRSLDRYMIKDSQFTRADIDLFGVARARQTVGKHAKRTVGASTVRKDLTVLVTMFKLAVRWGILDASPAVDVSKPPEPRHKVRYLSHDEWERLRAMAAPGLRPILTLGIATGMRLKEILGLRWEDVDRKAGLFYLSEDNKTGNPRVIPIGKTVKTALDGQVRHLKTPWIFTDPAGHPYTGSKSRNYVSNATIAAMRRAGIKGASFHTLRHTVGSWLAQSGESEVIIAKLLGHASTKTTERYMHLQPKHLKGAVRTLDAALASRVDTQVDTRQNDAVAPNPHVR